MKKLFVLISAVLLTLSLVSCPGGLFVGKLKVNVRIAGKDGNPIAKEVFDKLNCEFVKTGKETVNIERYYPHEGDPNYGFTFTFSQASVGGTKEIQSKYIYKFKNYGIKITDSSNTYQDIEINPMPYTGYRVILALGNLEWIEYTIQLKTK